MGEKYKSLLNYLKEKEKVVIAFSGGVDSTFLLKAAKDALGDNVKAITIKSPYIPDWEIEEAVDFVKKLDVKHEVIEVPFIDPSIESNPENRCYLCKNLVFNKIIEKANEEGYLYVCDGTNLDDTKDYRPGMVALKELGVISPLLESSYTKDEIRKQSKVLNLPTWDKPAYACLMTRLPYDTQVTIDDLKKIEEGEMFVRGLGFRGVRLRHHGNLARIEVAPDEREKLFSTELLNKIGCKLQEIGYTYVTFDVLGYRMGSFNVGLKKDVAY